MKMSVINQTCHIKQDYLKDNHHDERRNVMNSFLKWFKKAAELQTFRAMVNVQSGISMNL